MTNSREAMWAAFRAEIQALSDEDLAALIASFEADPEPGLDDAKLTELYAERDRRRVASELAGAVERLAAYSEQIRAAEAAAKARRAAIVRSVAERAEQQIQKAEDREDVIFAVAWAVDMVEQEVEEAEEQVRRQARDQQKALGHEGAVR